MKYALSPIAFALRSAAVVPLLFSPISQANTEISEGGVPNIDKITVTHQRHQSLESTAGLAIGKTSTPDLANWLASVPGANINKNGPVTGIAQYRGLYGDRLAVTLDGHPVIGAGPNAMDTPLSYSTPLIVESMTVYRGVAPVNAAVDTLAGAVDVKMRKADVSKSSRWQINGDIQAGYKSNSDADTLSAVVNASKSDYALMMYANTQSGSDYESGDDKLVTPTSFDKRQFGGDFRFDGGTHEVGLSYHYTDTQDSGTPALPMDIEFIFSHRVTLDGAFDIGHWRANWLIGFVDADHGMTNFLMRENNNPMKHRRNNAMAKTTDFKFAMQQAFDFGELEFGVDGYLANHDSVISNPNNSMFEVINFDDVQDDRLGIYLQWQRQMGNTLVQLGTRVKHVSANAGEVATSMAMMNMPMPNDKMDNMNDGMNGNMNDDADMPSMADLAMSLRNNFNQADRKVSDTLFDVAFNSITSFSNSLAMTIGIGVKTRAPSYQERYLWTPMESTGGLADGNTYIGDITLDEETAYQLDLGLNYHDSKWLVSPHFFYQRIDDYIQGTSLGMQNMAAKMMAKMMAGNETPLKFTNVDAQLYGVDVNWVYQWNDRLQLSGIVNYVKGERRDIDDYLYRIAPLNASFTFSLMGDSWQLNSTLVAADKQKNVSLTNNEQASAGYGVLNIDMNYYATSQLTLRAGVNNLLDKSYQSHLGGYNRVQSSEIPTMSRLPASGLSGWVELSYSF